MHLLAVLREALSNAARHAGASRVKVAVVVGREGGLELTISDDGVGMPTVVTSSGLRNARQRAVDLGGTLTTSRNEPHGTTLAWRVPLDLR